ncbi:hypothetical protein [Halobaculum sp. D14]|uniref:hypothetical protein n=1 Tax=Halobaculum sp. D14 TaxID=3421642 RepID=UPI003EBF60C2
MRLRRVAVALAVVGLLLVPAPLYLSAAGTALSPPPKTPSVYGAEPVDLGTADGRETVLRYHSHRVVLSVHQVSRRYSAGEYRAPNRTRRTLRAAISDGNAADDPAVRADLRAVARNYTFLTGEYHGGETYVRFRVRENGSVVTAERVTAARVANVTARRRAVDYGSLSAAEQRTVDRIVDNSTDDWGYRPRVDAAFADRLPALVSVDGTLYSLHAVAHVDDLGAGFTGFVYGVYAAGVGVVLLVAAGGLALVDRYRG